MIKRERERRINLIGREEEEEEEMIKSASSIPSSKLPNFRQSKGWNIGGGGDGVMVDDGREEEEEVE